MSTPKIRKSHLKYRPAVGTKRFYIIQALIHGGSPRDIVKMAIELAAQDGHYYSSREMRDIRVSWLIEFLRQRGVPVLYKKDTVRVFA